MFSHCKVIVATALGVLVSITPVIAQERAPRRPPPPVGGDETALRRPPPFGTIRFPTIPWDVQFPPGARVDPNVEAQVRNDLTRLLPNGPLNYSLGEIDAALGAQDRKWPPIKLGVTTPKGYTFSLQIN